MANLTTAAQAVLRLRSFDRSDLDYRNRMARQIQGDKNWARASSGTAYEGDDGFPIYSTDANHLRAVGQSRRMMDVLQLNISKFLGAEPKPVFTEYSKLLNSLVTAWFLRRYRGKGTADGGWDQAIEAAFGDGNGIGYGFVVFGKRRNPKTGKSYVDAEHVPLTQVWWEPLEPSPGRSSWIAVARYIPESEAIARWGEKAVEGKCRTLYDVGQSSKSSYCRTTEYWDVGYSNGYADDTPTYMVWLGPWSSDPVQRGENIYGTLPVAHYEHYTPSGRRRAIGMADQMLPTCEGINQLEAHLFKTARKTHVDVIHTEKIDKQDLERAVRGQDVPFLRADGLPDGKPLIERTPAPEVGATTLQTFQVFDRMFNSSSNTTDADRGNITETRRTASEVLQLQSGSQTAGGTTRKEVLKFYRRIVEKAVAVGRAIDDDPVKVEVDGTVLWINDPEEPDLAISKLLEDDSEILITPQSIETQDTIRDMQVTIAKLHELIPFLNVPGGIPLRWLLQEMLRAMGYSDPNEILGDQSVPPSSLPTDPQTSLPSTAGAPTIPAIQAPSQPPMGQPAPIAPPLV